ncbi:50S ribosomal protein L10 [Desulfonema magnum]|uniref:Large ribosomal subunit protein uL10 n=1 Tax=Desulfonema magnum TaxID=45655 RepID=A0A975BHY6_9BACT|nr:50S ribosomal protein L10 [Desulfonema magnum]QTA85360.1 50S ribosomal protein L10 [Desulfonema magnum]
MKLDKKKEIAESLHEKFAKSQIVIVTDYKGLDVMTMNDLRKKLRTESPPSEPGGGTEYRVAKNSLLTRASENTDAALISDQFRGPVAVALGYDDPVAPAKVLTEFAKENEKLEIKGGVMKGKVLDPDAIRRLSALPSREVLLSQALSAMNGVPGSFVRVLAGTLQQLMNVFQALQEQKNN